MSNKPLIIYHFPCHDGFAAAYSAWRKFGDTADYYPTNYGLSVPEVAGRDVYILDFSYPKAVMERIMATASRVVWLDHHKTAFEDYLGEIPASRYYVHQLNNIYINLDNTQSGAMLSWNYFQPDAVVAPYLIYHVQDRDLWLFKNERTRPFMQRLSIEPYDFKVWDKLTRMREAEYLDFIEEGRLLERQYDRQVKDIIRTTKRPCAFNKLVTGLAVNATPAFASEIGNRLAEESQTFGLIWYMNKDGKVYCSLRSLKGGTTDVSAIAKLYGGGGHREAAGFNLANIKELERLFV